MRYIKAEDVLPGELLAQIQQYADGVYIYIPRKQENRRPWGNGTTYRSELQARNRAIRRERQEGTPPEMLAEHYHLSLKSIARILREQD